MIKRYIIPILLGMLGVGIALGAIHLYQDHANLHALVNMVVQQQGRQRTPPTPEPAR